MWLMFMQHMLDRLILCGLVASVTVQRGSLVMEVCDRYPQVIANVADVIMQMDCEVRYPRLA